MSKKIKIMLAVVLSTILTVSGVIIASRGSSELKANESLLPNGPASQQINLPVALGEDGGNTGSSSAPVKDGEYSGNNWGVGGDGIIYYDANGNVVSNEAASAFSLLKQATATSDPNVFNVTLQFVTKQTTTTTLPDAAATVLVIDRSGSMAWCAECGRGKDNNAGSTHTSSCPYYVKNTKNSIQDSQMRIAVAKTATINFLKSYRGDNFPYSTGIGRYVSLVSYSTEAKVTRDWIDVSTQTGYDAMVSAINGLSASGGTNTDDGLYNASSQFDKNAVKNIPAAMRNVVLLTDGIPTYARSGSDSNGQTCSPTEYNNTVNTATALKKKSTLYTVCFGAANDVVRDNEKCGDFLANKIATSADKAFNASNTAELNAALAAITKSVTDGLTGEGTKIVDPIPAGITLDPNTIKGGTYVDGKWDLGEPDKKVNGNVTTYTYEITYQVHVDADAAGYNDGVYHPINGKTILEFPDGSSTPDMEFPVPGVTGQTTLYTVIFDKGSNGTLAGQDANGQVVYNKIKANAATPEYPAVTADEHYYFDGWDYSRATLVKDNTNKNGLVITFKAQYKPKTTIKFVGETAAKAYNGLDQSITGITVQGLPAGATWEGVTYVAAGHNASGNAYAGAFSTQAPVIKLDGVDISDHFEYEYETGSLTITPVQLMITTPDASKVYDGTELAAAGTITGFVNGEGEKVTFVSGADVTEVINVSDTREHNNEYSLTWNDVVSTNYTLVENLGTLTITPAPVTVTITGHVTTAKYDRAEHVATGYEVKIDKKTTADYNANMFNFSGTAEAKRTQYGYDYMGLKAEQFTNTNPNFDVTFVVNDGYVSITQEQKVVVTITGNTDTKTYDGAEHSVTGYTVQVSNKLYTENDFRFTGSAIASRTNVGTADMGLTPEMFVNLNDGFESVEFRVVDGSMTINPLAVTVTITGNNDRHVYDGAEHTVSGYTTSISSSLYTENDFTFSGNAVAARTNAGTTPMGLVDSQFSNTNASGNFTVTFDVNDGSMTITPVPGEVVVTIVGNSDTKEYDGAEHTVEGYTVTSISNPLYTEANITFSGNALASQTNVGSKNMPISESDFANNSANFTNVRFEVTPGTMTITAKPVTVTANDNSKAYGTQDPTLTATVDGTVGNDTVSYQVSRQSGELVGTYTINVAGDAVQGNYTVTYVPGVFTITEPSDPTNSYAVTKNHEGNKFDLNQKVNFTIQVKNIYNQEATATVSEQEGVTILPGNGYTVSEGKAVAVMAAGATITVNAEYTVKEADILAKSFKNTAKVTFNVSETEFSDDDTVTTEDKNAQLQVAKTSDVEGTASLGDTITYTITVKNIGNVTVSGIKVEDELTGNKGENALVIEKELAPGESAYVTATYVVTEEDVKADKIANTAVAHGTDPEGESTKDDVPGTKEDLTDVPAPSLAVVKKAVVSGDDQIASLGETITYTIEVTNNGNVTVSNITVKDDLLKKTWTINTLAPKANKTYTETYTVTEADILAGKIENVATAEGKDPSGNDVRTEGKVDTTTDPIKNKLEVVKTSDVEGNASLGDTINYTITVTNKGNVTVSNVVVNDPLTGNTGAKGLAVGTLAPGASKNVYASYVVTEADILAGSVKNVATATGFDPEDTKTEESGETEDDTDPVSGSLNVVKTSVMDGKASLGETITYTITVTNTGNVTVKNIKVEDALTGNTGDKAFTVAELAPKAEQSFTATYKVTEADILAGKIMNVATAKGTDPNGKDVTAEGKKEDDTDRIDNKIEVTKASNKSEPVKLGEVIGYTITVKNIGNVTVSNVKVTDEKAGVVNRVIEGSIAPGESKSLSVTYTVTEADILAGHVLNIATAKGSDPNGNPTEDDGEKDDPTEAQGPSLFVEKTSEMEGTATLGETITYTIKVTNNGNVTIKDIVVEDELTSNTGDKALAVGTLAPGAFETVTTTYVVTEADIIAGEIINVATAKGTDPNGDPTTKDGEVKDDTDEVDTTIEVEKAVKSIGGKAYVEGMKADLNDEIVYTVTVTNLGNVTLTDVTVEDALTGNTGNNALVIKTLAPNASETVEVTYAVTEEDILAGKITNAVTVTGSTPDGVPEDKDPEGGDDVDVDTEDVDNTITVTKTSELSGDDEYASLGETITYTITVKNEGNVTVSNIKVEDALVGKNGENAWSIASLAPNASETFTATYTVTEADILAGSVKNVATATGTDPNGDTTQNDGEVTDDTDDKDNTITVTKESVISGDDQVASLGETITYTITVKNDGNVTVSNIIVEDEKTGNVGESAWIIEKLAPGETWFETVDYIVTEADILKGEILNVASAKGTDPENEETTDDGDKKDPTDETNPSVFVEKTVKSVMNAAGEEKSKASLGDVITYTITVTNNGNLTLTDVVVEDELTGDTFTIAELAPKATEEYEVQYTVVEEDILAGKVVNTVTVNGSDPDDDPEDDPSDDDDVTTDTDDVDNTIEVVKTSDVAEDATVGLGDKITYTITVTNKGNVTVEDIHVVDELVGLDETIAELAPANQKDAAGQWTTTVTYIVTEEDIINGKVVNHVTAEGTDPNGKGTNAEDEISDETDPIDGSYTISKKIANAKSEYKIGETIRYTITVTNTGNITRHNVVVTDQLTGAAGKIVIEASRDYVVRANVATIAALKPGETVLVKASYKVLADDVNNVIKNVAIAEASTDDPTPEDGENPDPKPTPEVPANVEKEYTLTIHYQYTDGSTAAADFVHKYLAGDTFRIVSPSIAGYTPDYSAVNSPSTGMPAKDLTFTIVYTKNPDPVPEKVTPTEPAEEETTVEETTEETTTVEETEEETTVPEAIITEDENGDYDLDVIEPEKTPAGDLDLGHKCCILHFLLMLLAMILLCVYTDKRKKNQEDIHEIKKVLKEAGIDVDGEKEQKEGENK